MASKLLSGRKQKKIFQNFADLHDYVYFGDVEVDEAERPVTGITFSSKRNDDHYIHGSISGYDVTVLKRETKLKSPQHNEGEYVWTILKIDLHAANFPHIFIDAHHYDELLYKNIFAKFSRLRMMNNSLIEVNPSFAEYFYVFAPAELNVAIRLYLDDQVMQRMLMNFTSFDVEIGDNYLYVYMNGLPKSSQELILMQDEALWLAERIERIHEVIEAGVIED